MAIWEGGKTRSAARVQTSRAMLGLFAESLGHDDQVVMEATGPSMEIAGILEPHVARVVVANAQDVRAISHGRVKSDRFDARTLARLLAAGMLDAVWVPDPTTQALRRRVARRAALVRRRTRAKNEVHAVLSRCLLGRSPATDLFGVGGRAWLAVQKLPESEAETVAGCLHQIDFLDGEISKIDRRLGEWAISSAEARRLMTIPGVGVAAAAALMAAVGDISRFDSSRRLVAYLGLDPKVRQSGEEAPRHGRISKRGNSQARSVLVEAAGSAVSSPGPPRAFGERVRARKGAQVAAVAVARKIACLCWQLLMKEEDYAFARPSLMRAKIRRAELDAGAPPRSKRHGGKPSAPRPRSARPSASWSSAPRPPTDSSSPTGRRAARRAPVRQRGAHLPGPLRGRQRGRVQPRSLRLARWSPAPPETVAKGEKIATGT